MLHQDFEDLQVLVIVSESTDATLDVARDYARRDHRITVVEKGTIPIPAALNAGLALARGRWLVRVDAHSTISPAYVSRVVDHLSTGRWGGVGGRKDGVASSETGRAVAAVLASPFGVGMSTYHHGVRRQVVDHIPFGAYPTDLVLALGGWDERLTVNEDYEFDQRVRAAGHELLFDPELVISWRCRDTVRGLFAQYRRYGRGKLAVARLHPHAVRPRHLGPPVLVSYLAAVGFTARRRPARLILAAPYALAVATGSALTARHLPPGRARWSVPAAFCAMHLGWGVGFWEGLSKVHAVASGPWRAGAAPCGDTRAPCAPAETPEPRPTDHAPPRPRRR